MLKPPDVFEAVPASALLSGLDVGVSGELEVRHLKDSVALYIGPEDGHKPLEVTIPTEYREAVADALTAE